MKLNRRFFHDFHPVFIPPIGIFFSILLSVNAWGIEAGKAITPTDVYYLAKSVDDSLISMYELTTVLTKKRISNNLRPRNVYEKVMTVAEEFNFLHAGAVHQARLDEAGVIDANRTRPADVYEILSMIRDYLIEEDAFLESTETRESKSPGDVFQMLRQVSMHHHEIAKKKNMLTDWATPARVYHAVVTTILPATEEIAEETGIEYTSYSFPRQPVSGVIPRHVYKLLFHVYTNISMYYMRNGGYDPIIFEEVNDCDDISPADVFDLLKVIVAEVKTKRGNKTMNLEIAARYSQWKEMREKIVPGDVFRLIQHSFIIGKRALKQFGAGGR